MGDYCLNGPSHTTWSSDGAMLNGYSHGVSFDYGASLFDLSGSHDPLAPQMGCGELEFLDLHGANARANVGSSAIYHSEDVSGSTGIVSWPTPFSYPPAPEQFPTSTGRGPVPEPSNGKSSSGRGRVLTPHVDARQSHDQNGDEETSNLYSSLGASVQDDNSQQEKSYVQDPLDGLDDFRALLEAAENDELNHNGGRSRPPSKKEPAKARKRTRRSSNSEQPAPERKRSKIKDQELARYLDENFAAMNDGMGVVPKYRAKNRLRSIIKRKPGTQDTDLMSNNVEILGGRVDKQTLAWLRENFEEQPGQIMRREFLYERYLEFCQLTGREAMNAACVGKVVRTVFQGLSTRRLGRRGGSKYHYVNLQVVEASPFAGMRQSLGNAQKTGRKTKKQKTTTAWADNIKQQDDMSAVEEASSGISMMASARVWAKNPKKLEAVELDFVTSGLSDEERSRRNILQLATNCLSEVQINVEDLKIVPANLAKEALWRSHIPIHCIITDEISLRDVVRFLGYLRIHVGMLGGLMIRLNFHCIPDIITNFWQHREASLQVPSDADPLKFRRILDNQYIQDYLRGVMYEFMDNVIAFFLPTKFAQVPDHLRAVLRDVAVKFDRWMVAATDGLPTPAREILVSSAFAFSRVVESTLDLSSSVENLALLDRQKATRPVMVAAFDSVVSNGCLMTTSTSTVNRTAIVSCLMTLLKLPDGRAIVHQWDAWLTDFLQNGLFSLDAEMDVVDLKTARLKALDSFILAWYRLMLELEGAVRFPVVSGAGPCYGIIRFLRDSAGFAVDCEKARLRGQSLVALNAEAIAGSVAKIISNPAVFRCDHTLDHYIQCGIPLPLVTSQSEDFFATIPEVAGILQKSCGVAAPQSHTASPTLESSDNMAAALLAGPEDVVAPAAESSGADVPPVVMPPPSKPKRASRQTPRRTVAPRIKFT